MNKQDNQINTTFKIVNNINNPVNSAIVHLKMTLPDNSDVLYNELTTNPGEVIFEYKQAHNQGTYTSEVTM